jgi:hypothetical protein
MLTTKAHITNNFRGKGAQIAILYQMVPYSKGKALLNMQTIYEVVVKWKIKWHINPKK